MNPRAQAASTTETEDKHGRLEINRLSATAALRAMEEGSLTATGFAEGCFSQIDQLDPVLRAWAFVARERALEAAALVDRGRRAGKFVGALGGLPIGVKDIFNTYDMPTAMGSAIWKGFTPGNDARVVSELRLQGAIILGKTVTAEFAVHTPGETRNPHNPDYMPGTSSSGSAAAVAADMVPLAIGTQTAGSAVRPASYCGVYGFKPSFGLVPRTGSLKTTDSLDTVAWFARTVDDVELLFDVLRVRGGDHPFADQLLREPDRLAPKASSWRVAIVRGPKWDDAEPYAKDTFLDYADRLAASGIDVCHDEPPAIVGRAHDIHATIYNKALSYYFRDEFRHDQLISPIMKALIVQGQAITPIQYREALEAQRELSAAMDQWLGSTSDLMLTLSTGGEALKGLDAVDRPDSCLAWTLAGLPCLNIPAFSGPNGLPFGVQAVARRYSDNLLFQFARHLNLKGLSTDGTHPRPRLELLRSWR
jgi:Asp-tRNA(Asn)/Glu-tRNA(Gln) amidotransferase A subunit family amidase